jgi:hypothetical protein
MYRIEAKNYSGSVQVTVALPGSAAGVQVLHKTGNRKL